MVLDRENDGDIARVRLFEDVRLRVWLNEADAEPVKVSERLQERLREWVTR